MNALAKNLPAKQETAQAPAAAKPKDVKDWLSSEQFRSAIKAALPSHLTPERFVRVALTALMKTPKLALCTQNSVFKAMLDCSSLGLEPDGRRAHLIPFHNTKQDIYEVQLIIDYKGLIELAKRSGEIKTWRGELVCENDAFSWESGTVYHKIDWLKPRGKVLAVYSHVRTDKDIDDYEVMTLEQVEGIRKRSKAANAGPWVTDFNEMAKKTVIRRHSKRLTLSPEFMDALEKDDDRPEDLPVGIDDYTVTEMPKRIGESGTPEAGSGDQAAPDPQSDTLITAAQEQRILQIAKNAGITEVDLKHHVHIACGVKKTSEIKVSDYDEILKWVEAGGDNDAGALG